MVLTLSILTGASVLDLCTTWTSKIRCDEFKEVLEQEFVFKPITRLLNLLNMIILIDPMLVASMT